MKRRLVSNSNKARLFVLMNAVILFFLALAFGREYVGNLQIEHEIQMLEQEKVRLEDDRLATLNLIDELSSEEYLEREARTKHGLAKEGETLILIQGDKPIAGSEPVLIEEEQEEISNATKWYLYFFDRAAFDALKT